MSLKFNALPLLPLKTPPLGKLPNLPSFAKPLNLPSSQPGRLSPNRQNSAFYAQRAQKAKELAIKKEVPKTQKNDPNSISVGGMGKSLRDKGTYGFQRQFNKFMLAHKTTYRNLSQEERQGLHDMIVDKTRHKKVGSEFTNRDKKKMRIQSYKKFKSGEISREDLKDYKNVINKLQS